MIGLDKHELVELANNVLKLMKPFQISRIDSWDNDSISLLYKSKDENRECEIILDISGYHMRTKVSRNQSQFNKNYFVIEEIPQIKVFLNNTLVKCNSCEQEFDYEINGCQCRADCLGLT